ncbi:hypothetical protein GR925_36710 [Streptomyces sp. HUCO-GS316]|uniref:hypothetical protein n=1 Tax=Streptomyces sp. HUCO-GS316 TaxID=2692198 RepID=UPI00136FD74E|nr:hypothetical protein [Streptomyces sp. HUCO-GS316]MXM68793.1 hypothetical protein [Streptomyces sp. HUCO-GS316]
MRSRSLLRSRPVRSIGRALCAALLTTVAALSTGLAASAPSAAATADDVVSSHWIGLGYNQNPQPPNGTSWTTADWNRMVSRTDYMQPGLVRVMFNLRWFWSGTDAGGSYDFTNAAYLNAKKVIKHYVDKGVPVVSGLFGIDNLTYASPNTAAIQATLVKHLQADGAAPKYWVGVNEPNVATGPKSYAYADWQTATAGLASAFATAGVDTTRTVITGADTAEAGISSYDGDLGHQTAPTCNAGCNSALVWKLASLNTFTAQIYADSATDTAINFQTSSDGTTWKNLAVAPPTPVALVTGKNGGDMWSYTYTASGITGSKYLRLSVDSTALEHTVGSMHLSNNSTSVNDPLDDLTQTQTALNTGTWKGTNSWWLRSAQSGLLGASEAHFYSQELYGAAPEYVEPVMSQAVSQIRTAAPDSPVLLGETGMKALQYPDGSKDYRFALDTTQPLRMADLAVQEARSGVDGAAAWCLDGYASTTFCGMWGRGNDDPNEVSAHSTALRPWFYTWSLLTRYLPTGSTIHAPAEPTGVRVLAAQLPGGGWTFVLVNRTSHAQTVRLSEPTGSITLNKYLYAAGATPSTDANGFPTKVGTLTANFTSGHALTVGANSVLVFTTAS